MIRPLRRAHESAFLVLVMIIPALLVCSVVARHPLAPIAPSNSIPSTKFREISVRVGNFHSGKLKLHTFTDAEGVGQYALIDPGEGFAEPDVLLYWTSTEPNENGLPSDARLMGGVGMQIPFQIPDAPDSIHRGYLVLFSAAKSEVIDWTSIRTKP